MALTEKDVEFDSKCNVTITNPDKAKLIDPDTIFAAFKHANSFFQDVDKTVYQKNNPQSLTPPVGANVLPVKPLTNDTPSAAR